MYRLSYSEENLWEYDAKLKLRFGELFSADDNFAEAPKSAREVTSAFSAWGKFSTDYHTPVAKAKEQYFPKDFKRPSGNYQKTFEYSGDDREPISGDTSISTFSRDTTYWTAYYETLANEQYSAQKFKQAAENYRRAFACSGDNKFLTESQRSDGNYHELARNYGEAMRCYLAAFTVSHDVNYLSWAVESSKRSQMDCYDALISASSNAISGEERKMIERILERYLSFRAEFHVKTLKEILPMIADARSRGEIEKYRTRYEYELKYIPMDNEVMVDFKNAIDRMMEKTFIFNRKTVMLSLIFVFFAWIGSMLGNTAFGLVVILGCFVFYRECIVSRYEYNSRK